MDRTYARNVKITVISGCLLVSLNFFLLWQVMLNDRNRTFEEAQRANTNLVKAFEEQVSRVVGSVDADAKGIRMAYEKEGPAGLMMQAAFFHASQDTSILQAAVVNPEGKIVAAMNQRMFDTGAPGLDWFNKSRELPLGMLYVGQTSNRGVIPMCRRINKADGSFGGVVHIGVDANYFKGLYTKLELGAGGIIAIVGADGLIRVRQSDKSLESGQNIQGSMLFKEIEKAPSGTIIAHSPIDGLERMVSYRKLGEYPLYVTVGFSMTDVWRELAKRTKVNAAGAVVTGALIVGICGLIIRRLKRQKAEKEELIQTAHVQSVLREIGEAALSDVSLEDMYIRMHRSMLSILPAQIMSINLLDKEKHEVYAAYRSVKSDYLPERRPKGKGLTEYVIRQCRTVRLTLDDLEKLRKQGEYQMGFYHNPQIHHYLAAPLVDTQGEAFGVVMLTLDEMSPGFGAEDEELLTVIAHQVSMAIARKHAEIEKISSEARYKAVIEQAPEAVLICDPADGRIIEANKRFAEISGYDLEKDGPVTIYDLLVDSKTGIDDYQSELKTTGFLSAQRRLGRGKNGSTRHIERSARLIGYNGKSLVVAIIRDVSDEIRREQEIQRDAKLASRVQKALLPVICPSSFLRVETVYQPYSYVGGDFYFLDWRFEETMLRGFLIDTSGHGLATSLQTSMLHVIVRELNELDLPLSDMMRRLNQRVGIHFDECTFAGAIGFEIDMQKHTLKWSCAGIPGVWLATKSTQGAVLNRGMYLGVKEDEHFETHTIRIESGDAFYFMTDGLSDQLTDFDANSLGRFEEMVRNLRQLSICEKRRDDATAVCIKVQMLPQSPSELSSWPFGIRLGGYSDFMRQKEAIGRIIAKETKEIHSFVEIAVNEALANAMECRDGVARQHKAQIRFNKIGRWFVVRVVSSRMGFAGNAILRRLRAHPGDLFDFGEDAESGRGIPIMLSTTDRMTYNSNGTEVLLAWKVRAAK